MTAVDGGLDAAQVYKVIYLLHCVTVYCDVRWLWTRANVLDFGFAQETRRPSVDDEQLKLDKQLAAFDDDETKKVVSSA